MSFAFLFVMANFFCLGYPKREERIMRNKLLKCKDVVDVTVTIPDCFEDVKADICVYLTNDRYLVFSCVDYKMKQSKMHFSRINNIMPWVYYYDAHTEELYGRIAELRDINFFFPNIKTVQDIINNYDEISEFILSLNEDPDFNYTEYRLNPNISAWNSLDSNAFYEEAPYQYKLFKQQIQ